MATVLEMVKRISLPWSCDFIRLILEHAHRNTHRLAYFDHISSNIV